MQSTSSTGLDQLQPDAGSLTCIEGKYCNKPDLLIKPCRCKSQFCRKCSVGLAVYLREKLRPVVEKWDSVLMATLTVDPKAFAGPYEAWRHIGEVRAISRTMQHLRRKKLLRGPEWFSVLEFHKSGWPHFHVLLNATFVEHAVLREGWALGHVSLSRSKGFESRDHAVNYATKYVMKPDYIAPEWVLGMEGRIRRFSTSRGLLGSTQRRYEESGDKREYKRRTIAERREDCGKTLKKFKLNEAGRYEFAGTIFTTIEKFETQQREENEKQAQRDAFTAWKEGRNVEKNKSSRVEPLADRWDERT